MKWCVLFLFILLSHSVYAWDSREAVGESQKALLSYPLVKEYINTTKNKIMGYIPLPKEYLSPLGAIVVTASSGKIDTKPIRLDFELLGGNTKPNIIYNLRTKEVIYVTNLGWSF